MINDLISREALKAEFKRSANSVRNWKEGALNNGNEESAIRADAVLAYLTEVKGIIDNALPAEAYTKDEYEGAYLRGFADCYKLNGKPQETASEQERWLRGE